MTLPTNRRQPVIIGMPLVWCVALASCSGGVDQKKFEAVYRAGKAIEAGTDTGVNYPQYTQLLQQFQTEIAVLNGRTSGDAETKALNAYTEALNAYRQAIVFWQLKIDGASDRIPVLETLTPIATKYHMRLEDDGSGVKWVEWADANQALFAAGKARLEEANKLVNGQP